VEVERKRVSSSLVSKINRYSLGKFSVLLAIVGVCIVWSYLHCLRLGLELLPFQAFLLGVSFCSLALFLAFLRVTKEKASVSSLISLYIVCFGMLSIFSFRYDLFHGADFVGEFVISSITYSQKHLPLELLTVGVEDRAGRYASCLSVTIFPAILSDVSGIEILYLYKFIFPLISACVPLLLYLLVKEIFNDARIAFLSAMFLGTSHMQIFLVSYLFRQQLAHFFMLLSIFCILKFRKWKLLVLPLIFLPCIPLSHYTVINFALIFLFSFLVAPLAMWILRRKPKEKLVFNPAFLVYYGAVSYGWLYFFANPIYMQQYNIAVEIFNLAVNYGFSFVMRVLTTGKIRPESEVARGLPGSPIVSGWYYLTIILIGMGILYALFRQSNNERKTGWTLYSLIVFLLFGVGALLPVYIKGMDAGRIFSIGELTFTSMTALLVSPLLLALLQKRRPLKYLGVIAVIFVLVCLPMNLNLADHERILHYHTEDVITPEKRALFYDVEWRDYQFATWIHKHVYAGDWISVDLRGFMIAYLANHVNKTYQSFPRFSPLSRYLIVHRLFTENNIWVTPKLSLVHPRQNVSEQQILANSFATYNNGEMVMLTRFDNATTMFD